MYGPWYQMSGTDEHMDPEETGGCPGPGRICSRAWLSSGSDENALELEVNVAQL